MQASKIVFGKLYAVKHQGKLAALIAETMVTTRNKGGATNKVRGFIDGSATTTDEYGNQTQERFTYPVEDLLGPYEEYQQLVAERVARNAAAEAEKAAAEANVRELWDLLYAVTGMERPADAAKESYKHPFRLTYRGVDIAEDGMEPLANVLRQLAKVEA